MKIIDTRIAAQPVKPATRILHDQPGTRVVAFHLEPGQRIPAHRNNGTVILAVTQGIGLFTGESGEGLRLESGMAAVYAPGEPHSIECGDSTLRFTAFIITDATSKS